MSPMAECVRRVGMLSKTELRNEARRLNASVQQNSAQLVAHLAEIRRRGLPQEWGYSGLFSYCQKSLGMSEAEAGLRLQVAKVVLWCPSLLDALAEGRMTLTVAGRIAPHLTKENAGAVIEDCCGMTRNQVAEYVVRFRPKPLVSPGITKAPTPDSSPLWAVGGVAAEADAAGSGCSRSSSSSSGEPAATAPAAAPAGAPNVESTADPSASNDRPGGCNSSSSSAGPGFSVDRGGSSRSTSGSGRSTRSGRGSIEPAEPGRYNVRFPARRKLKEKIDRLAEVLGFDDAGKNLESVVEQAVELALERKDPRRKAARRAARLERQAQKEAEKCAEKRPVKCAASQPNAGAAASKRNEGSRDASVLRATTREEASTLDIHPAELARKAKPSGADQTLAGRETATPSCLAKTAQSTRETRPSENDQTLAGRETEAASCLAKTAPASRYIPEALRGLVLERSDYRCEYVSPEGYRCEQTTKLQIDHIVPYAKGGPTTSENLRCLCQSHNLWAAEKAFGKELVQRRIADPRGGEGFIAEASTPGYVRIRRRAAWLSPESRVFAWSRARFGTLRLLVPRLRIAIGREHLAR